MKYHIIPLENRIKIEKKANRFLSSALYFQAYGIRFPGCNGGGVPKVSFEAVREAPINLGALFSTLTFNQTKGPGVYFLVIG